MCDTCGFRLEFFMRIFLLFNNREYMYFSGILYIQRHFYTKNIEANFGRYILNKLLFQFRKIVKRGMGVATVPLFKTNAGTQLKNELLNHLRQTYVFSSKLTLTFSHNTFKVCSIFKVSR